MCFRKNVLFSITSKQSLLCLINDLGVGEQMLYYFFSCEVSKWNRMSGGTKLKFSLSLARMKRTIHQIVASLHLKFSFQ